jgi:hypothetical protein
MSLGEKTGFFPKIYQSERLDILCIEVRFYVLLG